MNTKGSFFFIKGARAAGIDFLCSVKPAARAPSFAFSWDEEKI